MNKHKDPIYFNRTKGRVFICLNCNEQLAGPHIEDDEKKALIEFVKQARLQPKSKNEFETKE